MMRSIPTPTPDERLHVRIGGDRFPDPRAAAPPPPPPPRGPAELRPEFSVRLVRQGQRADPPAG